MTLSHTAAFPAARYPRFYLFVLALLTNSFPLAVALRIALAISIPSFLSPSLPLPFPSLLVSPVLAIALPLLFSLLVSPVLAPQSVLLCQL